MFRTHENTVLRRARSEDAAHIARLYVASQAVGTTAASRAALDPAVVERWVRATVLRDEVWVAEGDFGRLAGVVALSGNELEALDVEPSHRRLGLGGRLIDMAKSRRPGGLVARVGDVRSEACRFLLHHGFTASTRGGGAGDVLRWRTPPRSMSAQPFRVVPASS